MIGRSPNCDIRVDDELLSKMQASIAQPFVYLAGTSAGFLSWRMNSMWLVCALSITMLAAL